MLSHSATLAAQEVVCSPLCPFLERRVYELYCDYVLRNPFYEAEQVVKVELFDESMDALVRKYPSLG